MNLQDRIKQTLKETGAQKAFMICLTRSEAKSIPHMAQIRQCSGCGVEILVSPSTVAAGSTVTTVCEGCAQLKNIGAGSIMAVTKEAIEDLTRMHGRTPTNEELDNWMRFSRQKCGLTGSENIVV